MIKLNITDLDDSDREIILHGKDMKELIDKLMNGWVPCLEEDLPILQKTKRFQKDSKGEEEKERNSGWYYDCPID